MGKFILKRGLKNVYAAEVLTDDENGMTFGTPFPLMAVGEMTRTVDTEKIDVYLDDTVFDTFGKENATNIGLNGSAIREDEIAKLTGKYVDTTTGAVIDTGDYKPKYFALLGQSSATDGSEQYFSFVKGTFSIPDVKDRTKDDTTEYNGMTLNYASIRSTATFTVGTTTSTCKAVHMDTSTSHLKTSGQTTAKWQAQVVTPNNLGDIVEKNVA